MSGPFKSRGFPMRLLIPHGDPVIMRRSDFLRVRELEKPRNEQLALLLGMCLGFRSGELRYARYEDIRVDEGTVFCRDTKDHVLYPLPCPLEVAVLAEKMQGPPGYILGTARKTWKSKMGRPVGKKYMWDWPKRLAREAGVVDWQRWTCTFWRRFFAKEWVRTRQMQGEDGNIPLLSRVMRHRDISYTWLYISNITYLEDLQREFKRFQLPVEELNRLDGQMSQNISSVRLPKRDRENP